MYAERIITRNLGSYCGLEGLALGWSQNGALIVSASGLRVMDTLAGLAGKEVGHRACAELISLHGGTHVLQGSMSVPVSCLCASAWVQKPAYPWRGRQSFPQLRQNDRCGLNQFCAVQTGHTSKTQKPIADTTTQRPAKR